MHDAPSVQRCKGVKVHSQTTVIRIWLFRFSLKGCHAPNTPNARCTFGAKVQRCKGAQANDVLYPFFNKKIFLLIKNVMEALVYASLLIGTLGIIFFAIFFREPPRIVK